ncbi:hypothetical protein V8E52_011669 [Russula decolorans]
MEGESAFWNGQQWVQRQVAPATVPMGPMDREPAFWNGQQWVQRQVAPATVPMGPMNREPAFWNGQQWVQRRVAPATDSIIPSTAPSPVLPRNVTTEDLCGMGNEVLADPQGQTQLSVAGVRLSEAFNNALDVETTALWPEPRRLEEIPSGVAPGPGCTTSQEPARRAAAAVPGGQAPGITINGEALRHPQLILQPDNQGASASGSSQQQNLTEPSQAEPEAPFKCDDCTQSRGKPVTFSCRKDLERHLHRTVTHGAPAVARCSCGKTVTRKDAMRMHRKYCDGFTVPLDDAEGSGQSSTGQGTQQT